MLFIGLTLVAGIGALSHQQERAFSASVIYLVLGLVAAVAIPLLGGKPLDPIRDATLVERVAEVALVAAVFVAGLKIERRLRWIEWRSVARLLLLVMPATIALVALFGTAVMGLSLGAAVALGAILAPTDPVLAGDIGVGPPGEEHDDEARFAVSAEAGMNDGLAFPFILLGISIAPVAPARRGLLSGCSPMCCMRSGARLLRRTRRLRTCRTRLLSPRPRARDCAIRRLDRYRGAAGALRSGRTS